MIQTLRQTLWGSLWKSVCNAEKGFGKDCAFRPCAALLQIFEGGVVAVWNVVVVTVGLAPSEPVFHRCKQEKKTNI